MRHGIRLNFFVVKVIVIEYIQTSMPHNAHGLAPAGKLSYEFNVCQADGLTF